MAAVLILDPAVASCKKGRSAFVHTDFQLLRRVTLRVRSALPCAGCCAAGQTTKNDGLSYGRLRQLPDLGSRIPSGAAELFWRNPCPESHASSSSSRCTPSAHTRQRSPPDNRRRRSGRS